VDGLRAARDGFAIAGTVAGFGGLAVLGWAPIDFVYPALGLVLVAALLLFAAVCAGLRAERRVEPQPPAMASRRARYHIDDAPTVHVGPRRPARRQ
jgi:hypothetical protein